MQKDKIIEAIETYLNENLSLYHDGYTEKLCWERFSYGMVSEIAIEIAAIILPPPNDVCLDCGGSGGVEIGENEYSTCPCQSE